MERKRLLTHTLKLQRERGSDRKVARTLGYLSDTNRMMGLHKEGIQQAKEALKILEQLGDTETQAGCLMKLASLLHSDKQFDAAEEAVTRVIGLVPENRSQVYESHRVLGGVYQSKGKTGKAIHHYELALGIASSFNWHDGLSFIHYSLALLFLDQGRFDDAHAHIEQTKLHTINNPYYLGRTMELQARIWYKQHRLKEARSEALRAVDIFEKLGATKSIEDCRKLLQDIRKK